MIAAGAAMLNFDLPEPQSGAAPEFVDSAAARRWTAGLPLAQGPECATMLIEQIRAIDASQLPADGRIAILDVLRHAALQIHSGLEARFTRKALPLPTDVAEDFALTCRLWHALAIAYLRTVPARLGPEAKVPLHRAAVVLRQEQYFYFLAGYEVRDAVHQYLYDILLAAEESHLLREPVADTDLGFAEDSNILGHIAWAFLLSAINPYALSQAQLTVANRAFSRWRDLAGFQAVPGTDPKAKAIPLPFCLPRIDMPDGALRWMDVRPVVRKLRKRVESLEAGETPESLKLGRELSGPGCLALMHALEKTLRTLEPADHRRSLPVALAFGPEQAYVAIERRALNKASLDSKSTAHSHERMAVFGFDNVSGLAGAVDKSAAATETWEYSGDDVWCSAADSPRRLAPTLVALVAQDTADSRLGVLQGLRVTTDGRLLGHLRMYHDHPVAARLRPATSLSAKAPRVPAFLLTDDEDGAFSLVVPPTAGVRPQTGVALDDSPIEHLLVEDVIERGSDFVRYACRAT